MYSISFTVVNSKSPLMIHLPKNNVIVSTALLKAFFKKPASKNDKNLGKKPQFEELLELVKLHHFLFKKRYHVANLSILSIKELILGTGVKKDLLMRDIYCRQYSQKELREIIKYGERYLRKDKIKSELNSSFELNRTILNRAFKRLI